MMGGVGVILITGAAQRIGRVIALHYARRGWDVGIHYNTSREEAESLAMEVEQMGRRAALIQADLAQESQVKTVIPQALKALGRIDILVNNASTFKYDSVNSSTREKWDYHLEPNLRAPFVLMQDFARLVGEGLVINMLDQRVWNLTPHYVSYTASKFALWGLTQSMALALAPKIRVNGVGPGPTMKNVLQSPEQFETQCASTPLGIGGLVEDICQAIDFFAGAKSVTGQMIAVDGGQHLGTPITHSTGDKANG